MATRSRREPEPLITDPLIEAVRGILSQPGVRKVFWRRVEGGLEVFVRARFDSREQENAYCDREADLLRSTPFGCLDIHVLNLAWYDKGTAPMQPEGCTELKLVRARTAIGG